jgi:hypothetical protein
MEVKEITWKNYYGEAKKLSNIDDQHLCNILWYGEVFFGFNRYNNDVHFLMRLEWHRRCEEKVGKPLNDGEVKRLPWKPLPIPYEIAELKKRGMIHVSGKIIKDNEVIGSITHVEGWKEV